MVLYDINSLSPLCTSVTFDTIMPDYDIDNDDGTIVSLRNPPEISFECQLDTVPEMVTSLFADRVKMDEWELEFDSRDIFCGRRGKRMRLRYKVDADLNNVGYGTDGSMSVTIGGFNPVLCVVHKPAHRRNRVIARFNHAQKRRLAKRE